MCSIFFSVTFWEIKEICGGSPWVAQTYSAIRLFRRVVADLVWVTWVSKSRGHASKYHHYHYHDLDRAFGRHASYASSKSLDATSTFSPIPSEHVSECFSFMPSRNLLPNWHYRPTRILVSSGTGRQVNGSHMCMRIKKVLLLAAVFQLAGWRGLRAADGRSKSVQRASGNLSQRSVGNSLRWWCLIEALKEQFWSQSCLVLGMALSQLQISRCWVLRRCRCSCCVCTAWMVWWSTYSAVWRRTSTGFLRSAMHQWFVRCNV